MPTRKAAEETFSPRSHSRALRLVVDRARAEGQVGVVSGSSSSSSSYAADGSIAGWSSGASSAAAGEEKQQYHFFSGSTAPPVHTVSLAAGPVPPPYAALSPYLSRPAGPAASFPHEIHSAQFAALAASFNASTAAGTDCADSASFEHARASTNPG